VTLGIFERYKVPVVLVETARASAGLLSSRMRAARTPSSISLL
jgi:hypothetical protein